MKIALVVRNLTVSGGYQRLIFNLANQLVEFGNNVVIYTAAYNREKCYPNLVGNLIIKGVKENLNDRYNNKFFNKLPLIGKIILFLENSFIFRQESRLLASIIDKNIDLINIHDEYSIKTASYFIKHKKKVPVVWVLNNELSPYFRNPSLKSLHDIFYFLLKLFIRIINKKDIKIISAYVVYDKYNQNLISKYLKKESYLIHPGVDFDFWFCPDDFKTRHNNNSTDLQNKREFRIISVGHLYPYRCFEDIINALKILDNSDHGMNIILKIVGRQDYSPDYAQFLKDLINSLGMNDKIFFLSDLSDTELKKTYYNSDAFIFVNSGQTWGLAVFEAMACGTPVILSTGCGASEILTDGENAFLVPPKSPEKIADAIMKLKEDPNFGRKLSTNGRKFVEENIRWDLYAKNMERVFLQVSNNKNINFLKK